MKQQRLAISLILIAFVMLATLANAINPLHEATDELRHYRFVRVIATQQRLPVQGQMGCSAQGHHPPLYYGLAALVTAGINTGRDICYAPETNPFWAYRFWDVGVDNKNQYLHGLDESFPWHGEALAVHLARFVNTLIGAGVVYLTWLIALTIWPQKPAMALGSMAFVAFNPMFVYMSAAINNDVIAAFSGAAVTLACVRLLVDEKGLSRRWGVIFGLLYGMALLSKFNLAMIGVLVATAVTYKAYSTQKGKDAKERQKIWRLWLEIGLISAGVTALIAGWWFVRNQMLYGEPTGVERLTELWGVRDPMSPDSWGTAVFELPYAWSSLWGRFGYGQIPLPNIIYNALKWVAGFAFIGLVIPFAVRNTKYELRIAKHKTVPILFLLLNVMLFFVVLFSYLLISPAGPMGRFFFPALPSFAILIFYGLSNWGEVASGKGQVAKDKWGLAIGVNLLMATLTLVAFTGYLYPAYHVPAFESDNVTYIPINAQFDSFVTLLGYNLSNKELKPGEFVDIDLYWRVDSSPPGNYLQFVHLMNKDGIMIAQRDTHPGNGRYPSMNWQSGDQFRDTIRLYIPETAYAPDLADLTLGLYAPPPNGYRLGISHDDKFIGDALSLGQISISPNVGDVPNPQSYNFDNKVRLVGYEYSQRTPQVGGTLDVTLYWQPLSGLSDTYQTQIEMVDENGIGVATAVGSPTNWQTNTITPDTHTFTLSDSLAPGSYTIHVTLIDTTSQTPQNIIADEDGHILDNRLSLSRVNIK